MKSLKYELQNLPLIMQNAVVEIVSECLFMLEVL